MKPQSYTISARVFHWGMAAMILGLLALGAVMTELPKGDFRFQLYDWHKQAGVLVLVLVVPRLINRLVQGVPALPAVMPPWEQKAAHLGHLALYALMVLVPFCGVLMSQYGNHPISLLGLPLPMLVEPDKDLHEVFEELHGAVAYALLAVVLGHGAAALRHHFLLKDDVLRRMLPGGV